MKVTPRTSPRNSVDFENLKPGDTFIHQGAIWMKAVDLCQLGVNLGTGECQIDMCGDIVTPVEATVTWKRKETRKKK